VREGDVAWILGGLLVTPCLQLAGPSSKEMDATLIIIDCSQSCALFRHLLICINLQGWPTPFSA